MGNRCFPSIPLSGGEADAVHRRCRGSHIHKGRSCGDLDKQITSGALENVGLGGDFRWLKSELEARYFKRLWADLS